jgi:polysaccharide biosynthesis protein PslG
VMSWRELLSRQLPTPDLWQGECGCPSTDYSVGALSNFKWTESRQARWLLRRVINDLRMDLEMISWYHTCDQKGYRLSDYPENKKGAYFGLLRMDDYTPKPSYFAYQTMCALFDSQTHKSDSATITFKASEDIDASMIEKAVFSRDEYLIIAYWLPVDVHEDMEERAVSVTISVQRGLEISRLVLIDPLNGEVLQLDGMQGNEQWHFSDLPLKDYPMLFADTKAFEMTACE